MTNIVTFDATAKSTAAAATSLTYAHNCTGTSAQGLLVVATAITAATDLVTGVTYNGVAMTSAGTFKNNGSMAVHMWYLINPATGSNNIVVTASSSTNIAAVSTSWTNASGTIYGYGTATGSTTTPTINTTLISANDMVVDNCMLNNILTLTSNQTLRGGQTIGTVQQASSSDTTPAAGTNTMSYTGTSAAWVIASFAIQSANPLNDTFTDTVGTALPSHTSDSGHTYSGATTGSSVQVISPSGSVRPSVIPGSNAVDISTWTPQSVDYSAQTTISFQTEPTITGSSTAYDIGIGVHALSGGTTFIAAYWHYNGTPGQGLWRLSYRAGGSLTTAVSYTPPAGTYPAFPSTHTLKIQITGHIVTVLVDGVAIITWNNTGLGVDAKGSATTFLNGSTSAVWSDITLACLQGLSAAEIPAATNYTLAGTSPDQVTVATTFTLTPNGSFSGTITPATDSTGTFSPTSLTWSTEAGPKTFTYTPTVVGTHHISTTNTAGLTNPSAFTLAVVPRLIITVPTNFQMYQRVFDKTSPNYNTGIAYVAGNVTGYTIGSNHSLEAQFNGGIWTTITSFVGNGDTPISYSGTFRIPVGQGTFSVRVADDTSVVSSASTVGCGALWAGSGQSNMSGRGINLGLTALTNLATPATGAIIGYTSILYGPDGVWKVLVDPWNSAAGAVYPTLTDSAASGAWMVSFGNLLSGQLGIPVGLIPCAGTGVNIAQFQPNPSNHYDTTTFYGCIISRIRDALGGSDANHDYAGNVVSIEGFTWHQGESNALDAPNLPSDLTNYAGFANGIAGDTGTRPWASNIQAIYGAQGTNININQTYATLWASGVFKQGPDISIIAVGGDGRHINSSGGLLTVASMWVHQLFNKFYFPSSSSSANNVYILDSGKIVHVLSNQKTGITI